MRSTALAVIAFWLAVAIVGPLLAPYAQGAVASREVFAPISAAFPLGTDYLGRDMLSRIIYGTRYTIGIAMAATVIAVFAYDAAMRDDKLPRKALPAPQKPAARGTTAQR